MGHDIGVDREHGAHLHFLNVSTIFCSSSFAGLDQNRCEGDGWSVSGWVLLDPKLAFNIRATQSEAGGQRTRFQLLEGISCSFPGFRV